MSSKKSKKRMGSTRRHQGFKAEEREGNAELQESSSAEHLQPLGMPTCQLDSVLENVERDQHDASETCSEKLETGKLAEICEAETSASGKKRRMGSTRRAKQERQAEETKEEKVESMQIIQEELNISAPEDQYLKEHSNTPEVVLDEAQTQLPEEGWIKVKEQVEMTEDESPNEQHRLLSGLGLKTDTAACSAESLPTVNLTVSVTGIHPNEEEAVHKQDEQTCIRMFEAKEFSNETPLEDTNQRLDQQMDERAEVSTREEQWGAKDVNLESNIEMEGITVEDDNKQGVLLRKESREKIQIEKVDEWSVRETEVESGNIQDFSLQMQDVTQMRAFPSTEKDTENSQVETQEIRVTLSQDLKLTQDETQFREMTGFTDKLEMAFTISVSGEDLERADDVIEDQKKEQKDLIPDENTEKNTEACPSAEILTDGSRTSTINSHLDMEGDLDYHYNKTDRVEGTSINQEASAMLEIHNPGLLEEHVSEHLSFHTQAEEMQVVDQRELTENAHFITTFTPQDVNQLQGHDGSYEKEDPESPGHQEGQSSSNMEVLEQAEVRNKLSLLGDSGQDNVETTIEDTETMVSFSHQIGFETLSEASDSFEQQHLSSSHTPHDSPNIGVAPPYAEQGTQSYIISYTMESEAPSSSSANVLDLSHSLHVESLGTSGTSTYPDHSESSFKLQHHEEEEGAQQGASRQKRRMGSTRRTKREHKMEETSEDVIIRGENTNEDMNMNTDFDLRAEAKGDILEVQIIGTLGETGFVTNQTNVDTPSASLTLFEQDVDVDKSTTAEMVLSSFPQCNVQEDGQENQHKYPDVSTERLDDNEIKDNNETCMLGKETAEVVTNQIDVEISSSDVQQCEEEKRCAQSHILSSTSGVSNIFTVVPDFSHSIHVESTDTSETSTFPDHYEFSFKLQHHEEEDGVKQLQHHEEEDGVKQSASRQKRRMGSTRRTKREHKIEETCGVMSIEGDDDNENMDVKTASDLTAETEGAIIDALQEKEFVTSQTEVETLGATLTSIEQDPDVDSTSAEMMPSSFPICNEDDERTQENQHSEATAEQLEDDYLKGCNEIFGKETAETITTVGTELFNEASICDIGDQLQGRENNKSEESFEFLGHQNMEDIKMEASVHAMVETKLSSPTEDSSPDCTATTVEDMDTTESFSGQIGVETLTCLGSLTSSSPDQITEIDIVTQNINTENVNSEMFSPDVQHSEEAEQRTQVPILSSTVESEVSVTADVSDFSHLPDHEEEGSVKQGASRQKRRMGSTRRTKRENKTDETSGAISTERDDVTEDMSIDSDLRAEAGGDVTTADIILTSRETEIVTSETHAENILMASSFNEQDQFADFSTSSEMVSTFPQYNPQEDELNQENQHKCPDVDTEQLDDNALKDNEISIPRQEKAEAITAVGADISNEECISVDGDQLKKHKDEKMEKSIESLSHQNIEEINMNVSEKAVQKMPSSAREDVSPDCSVTTVENVDIAENTQYFSCLGSSTFLDPFPETGVTQQNVSLEVSTLDIQHSEEAEQGTQFHILSSTMESDSEAPSVTLDVSDLSYSLAVESTVRSETDIVSDHSEFSLKLQHHEEEEGVKQGTSRQKKRMGSTRRTKRENKMEDTCEVLKETIPEQTEGENKLSPTEDPSPDCVATTVEDMDTTEKTESFSFQINVESLTSLGSPSSHSSDHVPDIAVTPKNFNVESSDQGESSFKLQRQEGEETTEVVTSKTDIKMNSPDVQQCGDEEQRVQSHILSSTLEVSNICTVVPDFSHSIHVESTETTETSAFPDHNESSLKLQHHEEEGSVKQGASRQKRRMGSTRKTKRENKTDETSGAISTERDDVTEDMSIDSDLRAEAEGDVTTADIILTSRETEIVTSETHAENILMASSFNEQDQFADLSISSEMVSTFPQYNPQEDELNQENQHKCPDVDTEQLNDSALKDNEISIPRQETAESTIAVGADISNEECIGEDGDQLKKHKDEKMEKSVESLSHQNIEEINMNVSEKAVQKMTSSSREDVSPDCSVTTVENVDMDLGSSTFLDPFPETGVTQQNASLEVSTLDIQHSEEAEQGTQTHILSFTMESDSEAPGVTMDVSDLSYSLAVESTVRSETDIVSDHSEFSLKLQHHEEEEGVKQGTSRQKKRMGSTRRTKRENKMEDTCEVLKETIPEQTEGENKLSPTQDPSPDCVATTVEDMDTTEKTESFSFQINVESLTSLGSPSSHSSDHVPEIAVTPNKFNVESSDQDESSFKLQHHEGEETTEVVTSKTDIEMNSPDVQQCGEEEQRVQSHILSSTLEVSNICTVVPDFSHSIHVESTETTETSAFPDYNESSLKHEEEGSVRLGGSKQKRRMGSTRRTKTEHKMEETREVVIAEDDATEDRNMKTDADLRAENEGDIIGVTTVENMDTSETPSESHTFNTESSNVAESGGLSEQWESSFRLQHHEKEGDSKQDLSKQKRKMGSTRRRKRESDEIHLDETQSSSATEVTTLIVTETDIEMRVEENLQSEQISFSEKVQAACINTTPIEEEFKDYQTGANEVTVDELNKEDMSRHEKPFLSMEETPEMTISFKAADVDSYTKSQPDSCSPHDNQININPDPDSTYCPESSQTKQIEDEVHLDQCSTTSEPEHVEEEPKATPRRKIGSTRRVNRRQEDKRNESKDEETEEMQNQGNNILMTQEVEVVEAQREEDVDPSVTQREVENDTIAEEREIIEDQIQNTVPEMSVTICQYQETEGSPGMARRRKLGSTRRSRKEQTERKYVVMDGMLMYTDTETNSAHDREPVHEQLKDKEERGIPEPEENTEVIACNTVVSLPDSLQTIQETRNNEKDELSEKVQCILASTITAELPPLVDMARNYNSSAHGDTLAVNSGTPPLETSDSSEESKPRKKRMGSSRKISQRQHKDKTESYGEADVRNDDSDSLTNTDKHPVKQDTGGPDEAEHKAGVEDLLNDESRDTHESESSKPASEAQSHPDSPSVTELHDQSHLGQIEISESSETRAAGTSFSSTLCADDSPNEPRSMLQKRKMGSSRRGQGLGNRMKGAANVEEHVDDINTQRQETRDETAPQSTEDFSVEGEQLLLAFQSSKSDEPPMTQGERPNESIEETATTESFLSASSSASSDPQEGISSIDPQSTVKKRKMGSTRRNNRRHGEDINSDLKGEQGLRTESYSDDTAAGDTEVQPVMTQKASETVQPEDTVTQDVNTGTGTDHKQDSGGSKRKMGSRRGGQGYRGIGAMGAPVSQGQDSDSSLLQGSQENTHGEDVSEQGPSKPGSQSEKETQKLEQPPSGARSKSDLERKDGQRETLTSLGEAIMFNIVMVGDSSVGKTSFIRRLERGEFLPDPSATLGVDTSILPLVVDGKLVKLQIWDTAGQERFHSITRQVLHKAQGLILMYDVSSCQSFSAVRKWIACIEEGAPTEVIILLLGNKNDSEDRQVLHPEGKRLAEEYNIHFMECSAVTGHNVSQAMETLARLLKQTVKENNQQSVSLHKKPQQKKSGCC